LQGKSLLLSHLFSQLKSTNVATIHCSALTNAVHVIQKLSQARHTHTPNGLAPLLSVEKDHVMPRQARDKHISGKTA
jgi:hypothetical protein